jgi:hypothetical protein
MVEAVNRRKVMMNQDNQKSAIGMDTVGESGGMRELSARELEMVGGGFVPGALADAGNLHRVTGSDGNSYKD